MSNVIPLLLEWRTPSLEEIEVTAAERAELERLPSNVSSEEKQRRLMVEIHRLADLAVVDWTFQLQSRGAYFTEAFGKSSAEIKVLIQARLQDIARAKIEERRISLCDARDDARDDKKKERAEQLKAKREEKEALAKAKLKDKEFTIIQRLPVTDRDARLKKLADQLKEEVSEVREQFAEFLDDVDTSTSAWDIEPWPEPVTAAELLQELTVKIHKHVALKPHQAVAVALWVMLAWIHETAATYSPYLVATSAEAGEGKSTLIMGVVGRLAPRPFPGSEPTAAVVYRTADAHKPTLLFDDVDTLFERKIDLTSIFKVGYTRGVKVPRMEKVDGAWVTVWYDPFCPKACNLIGTNLPKPLHSRCIIIRLQMKKATDIIAKPVDDDEFATLCRKLKRWSADNAAALKGALPSPDFINRESDNWTLQLAIAKLAGGNWPALALEAARLLTRTMHKPSWRQLLLADFQAAFKNRKEIGSEDFHKLITTDALSIWRDYGRGTVTQRQVAHLLTDLEIFPVLITAKRIRGYRAADFADAFARYLPPPDRGRDPLILSSGRKTKKERMRGCRPPSLRKRKCSARKAKRRGRG